MCLQPAPIKRNQLSITEQINMKIAVLPGDGIGTEIVAEAVKVLNVLDLPFEMESAPVGGAALTAGRAATRVVAPA